PLFRVSVLKIAENSHVLLFNIHHIISDGWSLGVLTREWMQAYAAYIQGESLALAPLTLQYKDYAAWQVAYLQSEMAAKHRHYWLEKFSGEIPVLNLETDCPRPLMQTFAGHTLHFVIAEHRLQAFNAVLNEHAASLFMGLMAVLKVLLLRYSGQQDLIVGTPVRGRMQQELEAQMGFYVNTLALRDVLDPQSSFIQVLEQVKLTATEAFDHQVYPFDQLVDELDLQRDMSRSPLFDVMLALQNIEPVQLSLDQLSVSQYDQENHWDISRFDLMFHFNETSEGLALALNYNTDLFTEERIQRLAEHYLQLLDSVVDAPQQAIKQLNFLSAQEKQWLLTANPQALAALPQFTISERFALQVKTTPENIALIKGSTVLSYRQLQQQVDALSGALYQALGAQHERQAVVGVYSERLEPVYLLACLQIGAVYVPLDSHLPEQRIQYMLSTAKCDLLLHGQNVTVPIALQQQCVCFCADNMETRAAVHATYNGQDLAYILFTSGSTGQPKGVMVRHQGFVAMALAQGALFKLTPQSRVLQFAAIGFDASLSEVFMAWFSGASLVLIDQPTISDAHRFLAFINSQQVTHLTLPPVYLKALNQAPMPSVEVLITAGEAAVIEDALYYARHCHYFNAYGPTEASVCASVYQVDPEQQYAQRVPIGKPLAHLAIFILDTAQNLLPQGLIGEIYIAGEGVASGYVGAAELTAQSFVSLPYLSAKPLYKTGDLGRWNSAGDLEFFGRNDAQIKLSGYRIETEEIAQTLMQHPAIAQAYVTVQHDQHAQPSLCAFYTLQQRCELWPSIAEFYVYDDVVYGSMANDERRNARYRRAFAKALPGKIVVEIGPGPELILSRLALEAGARKIYAIELLAETFHKARQTLKRLGLEDKITLIHGNALEVQLPEKVDYCISEIVGGIGGSEGAAKIINSARRFLKQPENMLPMRSLTKLAAIHLPETAYAYHFSPIATHYVERIFAQLGYPFDLRLCLKNLPDSAIISSSDALEDLDYTQDIPLECAHSIRLEFNQRSVFNGFLAWLNLYPDQDELIDILDCNDSWLPVYFPVSLSGISVEPGDILTATVTRRLCDNQLNPDYFISGQLIKQTGETIAVDYQAYHQQQRFRATPFYQQLFNAKADIPLREPLASNELRGFLAQTLAPYMLPQHFIELEQFPVNRNGKLDVKALPSAFDVSGQMLDEHYQAARNSTEQLLIDIWQDVLDQTAIGVHDHYFHRGGDSIRAIQIIARLRDAGLKLEVRDIFQQPTIAQLARLVTHIEHTIDQAPVSGEIPLTPIQHWFLQSANPVKHHFNQAVVLRFNEALQLDLFQQCLEALVQQHDMLRTSFQVDGELTKQICAEQVKVMVQLMDLREQSAIEQKMHLHADQVQAQLALQGNLFQAVIYRCADADHVLLYCHHLLIDGVSWRILLADLAHYYQQLLNQANVTLLLKTDAFKTHAQVLLDYAGSDALQAQLSYWQAIAQQVPVVATMNATVADAQTVSFTLSAADTRELLADCHKAFNTRVDDILLAALALSFSQWQQQAAVLIELEGHGRHELAGINTQRTVGWFTTAFPHVLSVTAGEDLANLIKVTKEDLRKIPEQGLGYGVLRYLSEVRDLACQPDVGFNYLGQFDALSQEGLFQVDWQGLGQNISSQTPLLHQIDFLGLVTQQVMQLQITFNSLRYSRAEIEQLSDLYQANLKALCAFCMQREQSELTPADLSFQDISMAELDDLFDA
ncbi:MAG: amino acid adenylation domain-containing protein, partial [Methylococcaceae bacterium]|nr:amino acid adenylation domain-containing protein [Methylococcaceae bacterium]